MVREAADLLAVVLAAMVLGMVLERVRSRQERYELSLEKTIGILLVLVGGALGAAGRLLGAEPHVIRTLAVGRLVLLLPALWLLVRGASAKFREPTAD
jgi:hypothetical protein